MVGRQTPFLALIVPLILVGMVDGRRGVRAVWPAAMVGGFTFAIAQFVCSNYVSVELTDIVASLLSAGAMVALPARLAALATRCRRAHRRAAAGDRRRRGARRPPRGGGAPARRATDEDTTQDICEAFAPYIIIIVVFSRSRQIEAPIKDAASTDARRRRFHWPGLNIVDHQAARRRRAATYKFDWATPPARCCSSPAC